MRIIRTLYHYCVPQKMPNWAAEYYDKLIDRVKDFYLQPLCEKIMKKYTGPARILDIGTGTGQFPVMLAQNSKNYRITAVDISEKCLKIARSKAAAEGVSSQITFVNSDLLQDNWSIKSFDLIISTCSMHHWKQPVKMLKKARQLTADKGEIWIFDELAEISFKARAEWIKKVEHACKSRGLFNIVYSFELRFLAYSQLEIEEICRKAGLSLTDFSNEGIFFLAQMYDTAEN